MKQFDDHISSFLRSKEFQILLDKNLDFTPPITITDLIERLLITHVKLWGIENAIRKDGIPLEQIADLRSKISYLNAVTRPRLVEALGEMLAKAVKDRNEELVREPNLKDYKER